MVEALRDAMHDHLLEPIVVQHRGIDEGGKLRLLAYHRFCLAPDARPHGVDLVELVDGLGLLLAHACLPGFKDPFAVESLAQIGTR
jgi:hypothetical protein